MDNKRPKWNKSTIIEYSLIALLVMTAFIVTIADSAEEAKPPPVTIVEVPPE